MNEPSVVTAPAAGEPAARTPPTPPSAAVAAASPMGRWIATGAAVLAALTAAALVLGWNAQQRVKVLEAELVKRQADSGAQAAEARLLGRQAQEGTRDALAKLALLEARVAESTIQRSQIEDLIQALARSRDENVLADMEAAIRVALQHSAITGSAAPLVSALRQADERLARHAQPRLERVRRAVAQDLDKARTAGAVDVPLLSLRLDEVIRQVDELQLLSALDRRPAARAPVRSGAVSAAPAASAASAASAPAEGAWALAADWRLVGERLWNEVRTLVRVTRIDSPEAMLVSPEQVFFLRENLKLRLLNARLALLSRQFDIAQSDLRDAQAALDRYFDRSSRRVVGAIDTVRQVAAQARVVTVPRPDATLAAIAAAAAGR